MTAEQSPTWDGTVTEIRFWDQVMTDARRTVICSPENESRCKGYVAARDLTGIITVVANPRRSTPRTPVSVVRFVGTLHRKTGRASPVSAALPADIRATPTSTRRRT